jgi:hypothetical protein
MRNCHEFPHSESSVGTSFYFNFDEVLSSCAPHHPPLQVSCSLRPPLSPQSLWRDEASKRLASGPSPIGAIAGGVADP